MKLPREFILLPTETVDGVPLPWNTQPCVACKKPTNERRWIDPGKGVVLHYACREKGPPCPPLPWAQAPPEESDDIHARARLRYLRARETTHTVRLRRRLCRLTTN